MYSGNAILRLVCCLTGLLTAFTGLGQDSREWPVRWKQLGPVQMPEQDLDSGQLTPAGMGWVESVAVFGKDERYIYAGSNTGGIYCSENGGRIWRNVSPEGRVSGVRDIVIDHDDPHKLWIATGTGFPVTEQSFGLGVMHSTNGGKSWQKTGLSFNNEGSSPQLWQIKRSSSDPDIFYACSDTRIYRSTDQCATFEQVYIGPGDLYLRHLLIHPKNPDYVVCSGARTLVSTDGGDNWIDITASFSFNSRSDAGGAPERIAICINPGYDFGLFAVYRSGYRNYIDESADWGQNWINVHVNRDFSRVDRNHAEIAALSQNEVIVGSVRLYKVNVVTDQVDLLTRPAYRSRSFAHDDIRDIRITPQGNIYIGTDGGVGVSRDSGKSWRDISGQGLAVSQVYGLDFHPRNPELVVIGCQDLGNMYYHRKKWHHMVKIYGDGGNVRFTPDGKLLIMQNGRIFVTADTGRSKQSLGQPFYAGRYTYPVELRDTDSGYRLTAADHDLWQRVENGVWNRITGDEQQANAKKSAVDVNHTNPRSILFANWEPTWGTGDQLRNRLYRSVYQGDTLHWEDITAKIGLLAWASVSDIVSHSADPERIWVSLYYYDNGKNTKAYKVYYSDDRGEHWENYSQGLPDYGTYCMRYIPGSDGGILLGTDGGVFYRSAGMSEWVHLTGSMPQIMVWDMVIDKHSRTLYAGTHGNGVWTTRLPKSFFR